MKPATDCQDEKSTTPAEPAPPPALNPVDLTGEVASVQRVYQRLLHYRRMSFQRGKTFVYPHQKQLAEDLILSLSTVKRAIARLETISVIKTVKTLDGNRYYFLDMNDPSASVTMTPPQVSPWSLRKCHHDPSASVTMTPALDKELNKEENKNSAANRPQPAAAAADLFSPLEKQEAETALIALDFPRSLVAAYAALRGPQFALLVATFCAERFRDPTAPPVKNKTGFVRWCLDYPEKFGFAYFNGRWELPPAGGADPARIAQAAAKKQDRERKEASRAEAAAQMAVDRQWAARWAAASEGARSAILAIVEARGKIRSSAMREAACVNEFRRQIEGQPQEKKR